MNSKALRAVHDAGFAALARLPVKPDIRILSGGCGWFGDVFMALNGIRFAELGGLRSRVWWGRRSLYLDAAHGPNAWSYVFEESAFDFSAAAASAGFELPYRPGAADFVAYDGMSVRASIGLAIERWCRPREQLVKEVEQFADRNFASQAVLGVHVRATDAAAGREGRRVVEVEHFLTTAEDWLSQQPEGLIFLASDDVRIIARFADRFGARVRTRDCLRSSEGTSVHGHYDAGVVGSGYRKSWDVTIDALLLARCHHLLRSHSRVSCYALCANPLLTFTDLDVLHLGSARTPWLHG